MKDAILLELADRWDKEAQTEQKLDGSKEAEIPNALVRGARAEKERVQILCEC